MMAILTRVRWNLRVVLICIAFMARDGEHFFHRTFEQYVQGKPGQKFWTILSLIPEDIQRFKTINICLRHLLTTNMTLIPC
jgi:hypothetical protein